MEEFRARKVQQNEAVMFDIDDTLIFVNGTPNQPVIDLLKWCKHKGYVIVIITARPGLEFVINQTRKQLASHGIEYDVLGFTSAKNKVTLKKSSGYDYVLSVGDQPTDLTGSLYSLSTSSATHNYYT